MSKGLRELHLFAGSGGGVMGGMLVGHSCICAVELDGFRRKNLLQRQRDGILPKFPIWDDVRTFDGRPWKGLVDVVCGGFPCQDISGAGKGVGITGERSGLWNEMRRIIGEVRPEFVFVENSPLLVQRGLALVLSHLAEMGYDAKWGMFRADTCGLHQKRERIYLLAHPMRRNGPLERNISGSWRQSEPTSEYMAWKAKSEPPMVGMANGLADRMDRLRAIGDGQVPAVVRFAWRVLSGAMTDALDTPRPASL